MIYLKGFLKVFMVYSYPEYRVIITAAIKKMSPITTNNIFSNARANKYKERVNN